MLDKQSEEEFKSSKITILAELTRLRQICCDPSLVFEDYKGDLDIVFLNKLEKAIRFAKLKVEKELVLQTEDRFLAEQDPEL